MSFKGRGGGGRNEGRNGSCRFCVGQITRIPSIYAQSYSPSLIILWWLPRTCYTRRIPVNCFSLLPHDTFRPFVLQVSPILRVYLDYTHCRGRTFKRSSSFQAGWERGPDTISTNPAEVPRRDSEKLICIESSCDAFKLRVTLSCRKVLSCQRSVREFVRPR